MVRVKDHPYCGNTVLDPWSAEYEGAATDEELPVKKREETVDEYVEEYSEGNSS